MDSGQSTVKQKPRPRKADDDAPPVVGGIPDFSHPAFKRLSQINGAINKLHKDELRIKLSQLSLDSTGNKEVLKKRLKTHYKQRTLGQSKLDCNSGQKYKYVLVIDFEATCDSPNPDNYPHEVIEFPVVVIDTKKKAVVDEFHRYVRPITNSLLTPFCIELTGITQEQVSSAQTFPEVFDEMWAWLTSKRYNEKMAVLTDGPWDMNRFFFLSCQQHRIQIPKWARKWINIRKTFSNFYDTKRKCLSDMLETAGLDFEGRPHSGLDDTRNIARLALRLLNDDCPLVVNETLQSDLIRQNYELVALEPNSEQEEEEEERGGDEADEDVA